MKWQEYQDAVGEFYAQMSGVGTVKKNITIPDKETGQSRQIDVWLEWEFKGHHICILVDAKFHADKLDVKDIEEVLALADAVNADKSVIVASNGWTKPAEKKATSRRMELVLLTKEQAIDIDKFKLEAEIYFLHNLLYSNNIKYIQLAIQDLSKYGSQAATTVPKLIEFLVQEENEQLSSSSADALSQIGQPAVSHLSALLEKKIGNCQKTVRILHEIGFDAYDAVPMIIDTLKQNSKSNSKEDQDVVCWYLIRTIAKIGKNAHTAIPCLIDNLKHKRSGIRSYSLYALGRMGELASNAIEEIKNVLDNEDKSKNGNAVFLAGIEALDAIGVNIDQFTVRELDSGECITAREWVIRSRELQIKERLIREKSSSTTLSWIRALSVGTPPQKELDDFKQAGNNKS